MHTYAQDIYFCSDREKRDMIVCLFSKVSLRWHFPLAKVCCKVLKDKKFSYFSKSFMFVQCQELLHEESVFLYISASKQILKRKKINLNVKYAFIVPHLQVLRKTGR